MALIKNKVTRFGIEAGYWKVSMISIDRHMKEAAYSLHLYLKKGASDFIESYTVSLLGMEDKSMYLEYFEGDKYPNIYTACYEHAKTHEEFFKDAFSDNTDI
ncbi:MAG TPA: hypothetical protein DCM59_16905 [Clostridium sp.]|nr:hypothetical protein [Clostridium sp.]